METAAFIFLGGVYLLLSWSFVTLAKKTGTPMSWLGWLPLAQLYLFVRTAGYSGWVSTLLVVPVLNIVLLLFAFARICKIRNQSRLWTCLLINPCILVFILPYLAFVDDSGFSFEGSKILSYPPSLARRLSKYIAAS